MLRLYLFFVLIFFYKDSFSQLTNRTIDWTIDWRMDIELLKNELPKRHYDFFYTKGKKEFVSKLDFIKSQIDSLSDFEIAVKLQQVIAEFGDSHTRLDWYKFIEKRSVLPLKMYWFSDGIYILKTSIDNKILLGAKVKRINGFYISEIIDSLSTLITVDNKALVKNFVPQVLASAQLLDYFKFGNGSEYLFEVIDSKGDTLSEKVNLFILNEKIIRYNKGERAYCWLNRDIAFTSKYFEEDDILYVKYNQCIDSSKVIGENEKISFDKFQTNVFRTLRKKKIGRLVFDMRFNSGGNSKFGTLFVNKLAMKNINREGRIFVIVGRKTFSSAIINTMDFKRKTKAIIVGEITGGKPNHFGEVRSFSLSSSKLKVFYSTNYFQKSPVNMNTIVPDVLIGTSFKHYINGIDPAFEWIKSQ